MVDQKQVHTDTGYERSDISLKWITMTAIATLIVVIVIVLGTKPLINYNPADFQLVDRVSQPNFLNFDVRRKFPEPRLQYSPRMDMNKLREIQLNRLHSYGWIDRQLGIVRIPIEEAIKLYIDQGIPFRPQLKLDHKSKQSDAGKED